jgi:hypothetical protein
MEAETPVIIAADRQDLRPITDPMRNRVSLAALLILRLTTAEMGREKFD